MCRYCEAPAVTTNVRTYRTDLELGFSRSERVHPERQVSADGKTVTWTFDVCEAHA